MAGPPPTALAKPVARRKEQGLELGVLVAGVVWFPSHVGSLRVLDILMLRVTQFAVLAIVAAIGLRACWPVAPAQTVLVVGPSMAPTLLGEHDAWVCVDCRFPFATGADNIDLADRPAVCPNCDCRQPWHANVQRKPGDRLKIDARDARIAAPRRWELIVFRSPEGSPQLAPQQHAIKRVVGLPGETVEVRNGDVWIDGARQRKTLAQQRLLAIDVHDSRFWPREASGAPQRWTPARELSGWKGDATGFRYRMPQSSSAETGTSPRRRLDSSPGHPDVVAVDWLQYTHWRRMPADPAHFEVTAVTDDYAYNRGESRVLNRVNDLMLVAELKTAGAGQLCFRGNIDGHEYMVQLEPQLRKGRMFCDGNVVPGSEITIGGLSGDTLLAHESRIEFSLIDYQVLLAVNGELLFSHVCPELASPTQRVAMEDSPRLAIGAAHLNVDIASIRILRDLYYIPPRTAAAVTLGPDQYYVLGDNSPLSADSRLGWPGPGLPAHAVVGASSK